MPNSAFRKHLSMPGLPEAVRAQFKAAPDTVASRKVDLVDCPASSPAIFSPEYPSLPQFDVDMRHGGEPARARSPRSLFGVRSVPSDACMRERPDRVDPGDLRSRFPKVFPLLQRGKALEDSAVFGGHFPLSLDGTGFFSSKSIRCDGCRAKNRRDGATTCSRQMLGAALVHPERDEVFALAPEFIRNADGAKKNDCARNAAKRFIPDLRRDHPKMKAVILRDGLASNGPHAELLKARDLRFIPGAKADDLKAIDLASLIDDPWPGRPCPRRARTRLSGMKNR